ncbi:MAG: hypothetical protein IJB49_06260 [Clostridia bacterium]|nr:hypothetical protein [Clostridia bacterium]
MKRINNDQVLDTVYDIASAAGMRIDEFLETLEERFGAETPLPEGIPEEIAEELYAAREAKKEERRKNRLAKSSEEASAEIKRFRELFPEVSADDIPDEVWDDVASGATLAHAFALYSVENELLNKRAADVNERNSKKSAAASSEGSTEPIFTKEQVEKMNGKDVKNNYKGILRAMKSWRFN